MIKYYVLSSLSYVMIFAFYFIFLVTVKVVQYTKKYNTLPKISRPFIKYIFSSKWTKFLFILLLIALSFITIVIALSYKHIAINWRFILSLLIHFFLLLLGSYSSGMNIGYRSYVNNKKANLNASALDKKRYYFSNLSLVIAIVLLKILFY